MNYETYQVKEKANGTKEWYKKGQYHLNGKHNKDNGPAVEQYSYQEWKQKTKNTKQKVNKTPNIKKINQYVIEVDGIKYKKMT